MVKACLFDLDGVVFDTELYTPCFGEIWIKDFVLTLIILSILLKDRHLFRYTNKYFTGDEDNRRGYCTSL